MPLLKNIYGCPLSTAREPGSSAWLAVSGLTTVPGHLQPLACANREVQAKPPQLRAPARLSFASCHCKESQFVTNNGSSSKTDELFTL